MWVSYSFLHSEFYQMCIAKSKSCLCGYLIYLGALQAGLLDLESGLSGLAGSSTGYIVCSHLTPEAALPLPFPRCVLSLPKHYQGWESNCCPRLPTKFLSSNIRNTFFSSTRCQLTSTCPFRFK